MSNTTTSIFEQWMVTAKRKADADARAKNIDSHVGHKVTADDFDYEKVDKVNEHRNYQGVIDNFNSQSHNSGRRYYKVEGTDMTNEDIAAKG